MLKSSLVVLYRLILLRFKKKKHREILLVADYGKSGGTRTYLISLLQFLKKQRYEVTVLMYKQETDVEINNLIDSLDFKTIPSYFDFWCIDFEEIPLGLTKKKLINYQLKEMSFWCGILEKNNFRKIIFSVANPGQYLYAFLLPLRVCYILHSQPINRADKYKRFVLSKTLSRKKSIITVSVSSKEKIEAYWLQSKGSNNINVVYNYFESKCKKISEENVTGIKRVLTIGSVESYKNPFIFIECAKQIIGGENETLVEFVWAGEGSLLQKCRMRVRDYPQIQFIDHVGNVEKLYREATIYYQPSLLESHGIATVGAMYYRLPCVVSDNGGLKESVEDGKGGFVIPVDDITASVEKIKLLLHNESLCKQMGNYNYERFQKKFTKQIWEKEMTNLFNVQA